MKTKSKIKAYAVVKYTGYMLLRSIARNRSQSWKQATMGTPKKAWVKDGYRCVAIEIEAEVEVRRGC